MCEKPMRRDLAQSSTAVTSAPDCETKATSPGSASVCAKLAFRPRCGRQQAEAVRARARAADAAARHRAWPASAPRQGPAVITMAARVPSRPSSAIRPGTVSGGVHSTARSGACGRSAARANTGYAVERGVLGIDRRRSGPANVPARRLRHTVAPTLPTRSDAPMTATDFGSSSRSRWRMLTGGSKSRSRHDRLQHEAAHRVRAGAFGGGLTARCALSEHLDSDQRRRTTRVAQAASRRYCGAASSRVAP